MSERFHQLSNKVNKIVRGTNPDLYSGADARHALSKVNDVEFNFGPEELDLRKTSDRAKIWSLDRPTFERIRSIVREAGHAHLFPFIMGTYHMDNQKMRMNDVSLSDPLMIPLMAAGYLEIFGAPIMRGVYFFGRRSWWRHESIHARHHHQMADFLDAKDNRRRTVEGRHRGHNLDEAAATVHEAGIEELLTRWQSLKESRGKREKLASTAAMLLYLEYSPFTGLRNMFIDGKEKFGDVIESEGLRRVAMVGVSAGIVGVPIYTNSQTGWFGDTSRLVAGQLPYVSEDSVEGLMARGIFYTALAPFSAAFSVSDKGAFKDKFGEGRVPTKEYKFPYTYEPVSSVTRSVGFLRYLGKVWNEIPDYRIVKSIKDAELLKKEIDTRLSAKMNDSEKSFTMDVLEDAFSTLWKRRGKVLHQELYVKGMFVPALYLRLAELYR